MKTSLVDRAVIAVNILGICYFKAVFGFINRLDDLADADSKVNILFCFLLASTCPKSNLLKKLYFEVYNMKIIK